MKTSLHSTLTPFALAPLALALAPARAPACAADEIRFAPAAGLALHKSVRHVHESELHTRVRTTRGGKIVDAFDSTSTRTQELAVSDVYARVGAEPSGTVRPLTIVRTFEAIAAEELDRPKDEARHGWTLVGTSPLEERSVRFEWNETAARYDARAVDEELAEDVTDGLEADLDFAWLLPRRAPAVGDEWRVKQGAGALFAPGGDLAITRRTPSGEPAAKEDGTEVDESFESDLRLRFVETRDEGVVRLAVVAVEGVIRRRSETELDGDDTESTSTLRAKYEVEGELLWNLSGRHLHALRLEADTESSLTAQTIFRFQGERREHAHDVEETGKWTFEAVFTADYDE